MEHICKEADEKALGKIAKMDKQRESYYKYYTGRNFGEAGNYDICLNSSRLGIDRCVEMIRMAYEQFMKEK